MSKTWLITGSARGLGRAIADAALQAGNNVVATARNPDSLADLRDTYGSKVRTVKLDVTDETACAAAVGAAVEAFGRLDVLVNNAGFGRMVPFEQSTSADFRAEVDANLFGVVNLTRAALPLMRKQRSGYVINISSVGGRIGTPGLSAYQAAKWAVSGFSEVLSQEAAPFGVVVIAIEPGGMRTGWGASALNVSDDLLPDYQPSVGAVRTMLKAYAGHEMGDPEKIARVIVGLTSLDSLPPHLLIGSDALHVYRQTEAARARAMGDWESVSTSTNYPDVDLSFLQGGK